MYSKPKNISVEVADAVINLLLLTVYRPDLQQNNVLLSVASCLFVVVFNMPFPID